MKLKAHAKVNLGLDVVAKNAQGYHDLHSIFVPIQLHDQILIRPSLEMRFSCVPNFRIAPEKNTLLKMVEVCREAFHFTQNFEIQLFKSIPSQAGLGGGSADAAAILNYLDRFFRWKLSDAQKIELALKVGADVPFCVFNQPAEVRGIGEQLSFFDVEPICGIVLVQPKKGVSTKKAFEGLDIPHLVHPDIDALKQALIQKDYPLFLKSLGNSLEAKAISLVPEIQTLKQRLLDLGCDGTLMTGSGSVVMGFSQNETLLKDIATQLKGKVRFVRKTNLFVKSDQNLIK